MPDLWAEREYFAATAPATRRQEEAERRLRDDARACDLPPGSASGSRGYTWTQTDDTVEVSFPAYVLPAAFRPAVSVSIGVRHLSVKLLGETAFEDALSCRVSQGESTWSVLGGVLSVELQKLEADSWVRCGAGEPHRDDVFRAHQSQAVPADMASASPIEVEDTQTSVWAGSDAPPDEGDGNKSSGGMPDSFNGQAPTVSEPLLATAPAVRTGRRPRPAGGPSTGTGAERERQRREEAARNEGRWATGTKAERWQDPKRRPPAGYVGPVTAAEAVRRGEGQRGNSSDESD